jgi:hypothetical protein
VNERHHHPSHARTPHPPCVHAPLPCLQAELPSVLAFVASIGEAGELDDDVARSSVNLLGDVCSVFMGVGQLLHQSPRKEWEVRERRVVAYRFHRRTAGQLIEGGIGREFACAPCLWARGSSCTRHRARSGR